MKSRLPRTLTWGWALVGLCLSSSSTAGAAGSPGVDEHTIALWLFDDPSYANVTLTDASPHRIDLRLWTGQGEPVPQSMRDGSRGLVPGKYGHALALPIGGGRGVSWPANLWAQHGMHYMDDRGAEVPEMCNLGYTDWTLELWLKGEGPQPAPGVLWEIRNETGEHIRYIARGFGALLLDGGRQRFLLKEQFVDKDRPKRVHADLEFPIPTDPERLNDGDWHHLAFTFDKSHNQIRHYVDGVLQELPGEGGFLPLQGTLAEMRLGRDAEGGQELVGLLDEMRLSGVVRYAHDFTPPGGFSRNYGPSPPPVAQPNGPPLLFAVRGSEGPLELGARKHLFIDDALLEEKQNLSLVPNPPTKYEITDFQNSSPWDGAPRFGEGIPDICSVWDGDGEIGMLYTNGGMYSGKPHYISRAVSRDGVHWEKPDLNLVSYAGSTANNIVLPLSCQGSAMRDTNPQASPDARYKLFSWCMNYGFYLFTSPDGRRWTRNEVTALPFDPDGSSEIFWDDQRGRYQTYMRALYPVANPGVTRSIVRAETTEVFKPFPFQPVAEPAWHGPRWPLPKNNSGELPVVDTGGQVYRFKGIKYPWAPDVYLAFPWRFIDKGDLRPGSFLAVSRDGESWTRYEPPYYFGSGWEIEGREVMEALSEQGLVRRGDEIWQFATVRVTTHGGVRYGGHENDGSMYDRLLKYTQRLDGFVSLDATSETGTALTRAFVFEGQRLELNVAAQGSVRVALLDDTGQEIEGRGLADCDPISTDALRHVVTWNGDHDLGGLSGRSVRLRLEMRDAKLYALQFVL